MMSHEFYHEGIVTGLLVEQLGLRVLGSQGHQSGVQTSWLQLLLPCQGENGRTAGRRTRG